jgi:mannose-1-phosphate guanylyltransferase
VTAKLDVRVDLPEPGERGGHLRFADLGVVVQQLPLEIVRGDPIEVGDSEGAHSGGGKVERCWAPQPPGAHDENLRLPETLLAFPSDFGEQQVPTVAAEFVGGEQGHGGGLPDQHVSLMTWCKWKLRASADPIDNAGMPQQFVVIIAGGRGERFWPLSRRARPKHLLEVIGSGSLLEQTLRRVAPLVRPANTLIITSAEQARALRAVCPNLPKENIVVEPAARNTGPAVALAAALIAARDPQATFAVLPADHVVRDVRAYRRDLKAAFAAAATREVLVTLGIRPTVPATGFGYIRCGGRSIRAGGRSFARIERFVEKPALAAARRYLAAGNYFWNAGMFVWQVESLAAAFRAHAPALWEAFEPLRVALATGSPRQVKAAMDAAYARVERISIDHALLEKASTGVVLPASFDWDDVGSWAAVRRHMAADASGNCVSGEGVVVDGRGNLVIASPGRVVALLGLNDCVVVQTDDATLVMPRAWAEQVRSVVQQLERKPSRARWL